MTKLLVSVTSADEAREAVENGADLIDVKDPRRGSLGAATTQVWRDVLAAVEDEVPVSAALGELSEPASIGLARETAGLHFAKVGLAGCAKLDWRERWSEWRAALAPGLRTVAVVYADWRTCGAPSPFELLQFAQSQDVSHVLLDTCDKSLGSLRGIWSDEEIEDFCAERMSDGLCLVVAGSLRLEDLSFILPIEPDYVAVRGAVCRGDRTGPLDGALVRKWTSAFSIIAR